MKQYILKNKANTLRNCIQGSNKEPKEEVEKFTKILGEEIPFYDTVMLEIYNMCLDFKIDF